MKNVIYWLNLFIIAYAVRMCNITELKKERTFCVLAVCQVNIQSYIIAFIPSPHLGLAVLVVELHVHSGYPVIAAILSVINPILPTG